MDDLITDDFMKQFGGSAAANGVTIAVLGLLMLLKKLCDRPSKCRAHLHCPCLDVDVMDRSKTNRTNAPKIPAETGPAAV
jgi:hypothetical protein